LNSPIKGNVSYSPHVIDPTRKNIKGGCVCDLNFLASNVQFNIKRSEVTWNMPLVMKSSNRNEQLA